MTNKQRLNSHLAAILSVLNETSLEVPAGHLYAALITADSETTLDHYNIIEKILLEAKLVTKSHECLTITPKGRDIAKKVDEFQRSNAL